MCLPTWAHCFGFCSSETAVWAFLPEAVQLNGWVSVSVTAQTRSGGLTTVSGWLNEALLSMMVVISGAPCRGSLPHSSHPPGWSELWKSCQSLLYCFAKGELIYCKLLVGNYSTHTHTFSSNILAAVGGWSSFLHLGFTCAAVSFSALLVLFTWLLFAFSDVFHSFS